MVSIDSLLARLRLLGLALAGAVCAHTLAYAVTFPDRMARQSVLQVTGHAYWHAAAAAAGVGVIWFAVHHAAGHVLAGRQRRPFTHDLRQNFVALAALQLATFAGMEVIERAASGAPLTSLLDQHVLVVGLGVQLLVAAALALASHLLARGAHALGRALAAEALASRRLAATPVPPQRWPFALAVVPCGTRGPPSSSL